MLEDACCDNAPPPSPGRPQPRRWALRLISPAALSTSSVAPADVLQVLPPLSAPPHPPNQVHASSPTPSSQLPPPLGAPRQLGSNSAQHFPRVCSSSSVPISEMSATILPVLPGQKPGSPPYHPSFPFCPSLTPEPYPLTLHSGRKSQTADSLVLPALQTGCAFCQEHTSLSLAAGGQFRHLLPDLPTAG